MSLTPKQLRILHTHYSDLLHKVSSGIVIKQSNFLLPTHHSQQAFTYRKLLTGTPMHIRANGHNCTSRFMRFTGTRAYYSTKCNPSTTGKRWHQWIEPLDPENARGTSIDYDIRVYCDCLHFLYSGVLWLLQSWDASDQTISVPAPTVKRPYFGLCKHLVACGPYLNVLDYLDLDSKEKNPLLDSIKVKEKVENPKPSTPLLDKSKRVPEDFESNTDQEDEHTLPTVTTNDQEPEDLLTDSLPDEEQ